MAQLFFPSEKNISTTDFAIITDFLTSEGIPFGQFPLNSLDQELSAHTTLTDENRALLVASHPDIVEKYSQHNGYRQDVICLHPSLPYIDVVLEKFKDIHYHYENEHWYYIDGCSGFGFLGNNGRKFIVEISAGEYLTVPEGKWQWVIPPKDKRMKAMRFFNTSGKILQPNPLNFVNCKAELNA